MLLQTEIPLPKIDFLISHQDALFSIGSCFSTHIGQRFSAAKFSICNNPFGTQFNPISIQKGIENIIAQKKYVLADLNFQGELFSSFDFHSDFSDPIAAAALVKMNEQIEHSFLQLSKSKIIFISEPVN